MGVDDDDRAAGQRRRHPRGARSRARRRPARARRALVDRDGLGRPQRHGSTRTISRPARSSTTRYERTKYEAERLVRARDAPAADHGGAARRSSSATAATGEIDKLDGPYYLMVLIATNASGVRLPLLGRGDAPLHLVPIDYVIEAAWHVARGEAAAGKTFHLVDPAPLSARAVFEGVAEHAQHREAARPHPAAARARRAAHARPRRGSAAARSRSSTARPHGALRSDQHGARARRHAACAARRSPTTCRCSCATCRTRTSRPSAARSTSSTSSCRSLRTTNLRDRGACGAARRRTRPRPRARATAATRRSRRRTTSGTVMMPGFLSGDDRRPRCGADRSTPSATA